MRKVKKCFLMIAVFTVLLLCNPMTAQAAKVGRVSIKKVKQIAAKQIKVTWGKVSGASGYEVQFRVSNGEWETRDAKQLECVINQLKVNKTYQIRVRAYKSVKKKNTFKALKYGKFSTTKRIKVKKMASSNATSSLYFSTKYIVRNRYYSGRCLDINNWSVYNRGNLETYAVGREGKGTTNQIFTIEKSGVSGWYSLKVYHSQKYIHYDDHSSNNVVQWDGYDHDNARWQFYSAGNGYHYLYNKSTGKYLYADTSGKNVCLRRWGDGTKSAFQWRFEKTNSPRFSVTYKNMPTSNVNSRRTYYQSSLLYLDVNVSSQYYPITRTELVIFDQTRSRTAWRGSAYPDYLDNNIRVSAKIRDLGLSAGNYLLYFVSYTPAPELSLLTYSQNYYFRVN